MRESVLAVDLQVGDLILESGIGGVSGLVTRVSVGPKVVGIWLTDGTAHGLSPWESCTIVERDLRAEAA